MTKRNFTPYEQTQLARYGKSLGYKGDVLSAPVEYLTGKVEFCGLVFDVSPKVLIPRIETEQLVELAMQDVSQKIVQHKSDKIRIADVGTGSGAVAIVIAKHLSGLTHRCDLIASDVSRDALQVAQRNYDQLKDLDTPQVNFIRSDLLSSYPAGKIDVLVANLPYIPTSYVEKLDDSVLQHEPRIALDGGEDGLDLIVKLLDQAALQINNNGVMLLEINHTHRLSDFDNWSTSFAMEIIADENGANRYLRAVLKN